MCRNIRKLRNIEPPATEEDIKASTEQYVRKISGLRKPTKATQEAFDQAVMEITAISKRFLLDLEQV